MLLGEPCEVRIDYSDPDVVMADVSSTSSADYLILRWIGGAWEPAEDD